MEPSSAIEFLQSLDAHKLELPATIVETLQVNITKLCNQACQHCHVDASPKRTEQMDKRTVDRCLHWLKVGSIQTLDITGGAPELNPHFEHLVQGARELGKSVTVRHNLTVTFDGNPQTGEKMGHLPHFFADNQVELVCSLPCYEEENADKQRGQGVFKKSIESLKRLNEVGYGIDGSGLKLSLVYNPVGPHLPPDQQELEWQYKKELWERYGLRFNDLIAITNMPIHRYERWLRRNRQLDGYMEVLHDAFNPEAARNVMCRTMISVGHDGSIYDCDFNQMLELPVASKAHANIFDSEPGDLANRSIVYRNHCFGCTAGAGSSCKGTLS